MDVSIAVSLIRGQMGAVVERAVNGAVETVLAEMLKVVGVKFEELKGQVSALKRDVSSLQREKAAKEKENDKIRAMLRYSVLQLKYYRQGLEEEGPQAPGSRPPRARLNTLAPGPPQGRNSQEGRGSGSSQRTEMQDSEWNICLQSKTGHINTEAAATSPGRPAQADSSTLPCRTPLLKVKQEEEDDEEDGAGQEEDGARQEEDGAGQEEDGAGQELICIKEEPQDQQEVMATLLLDCELQGQLLGSEGQRSGVADQMATQDHSTPYSSQGHSHFSLPHPAPLPFVSPMSPVVPPRQAVRPWPKDLSLYEEYKLRRNELRRRSLNRRRELEKNLPQPLLADLVRERREKTRLRVARWRAKRKMQACLNQSQAGVPDVVQIRQQQLKAPCGKNSYGSTSSHQPQPSFLSSNNLTFITPSSSSSSSLLIGGHHMAEHVNQHTVSSSSSQPQTSLSQQSISLMDTDIFQ